MSDIGLENYLQARIQLNRSFANPNQVNNLFRVWESGEKSRALTLVDIADIWGDNHMGPLAYVLAQAGRLGLIKHVYIVNGVPFGDFLSIPDFASMDDVNSYYLMARSC